MQKRLTYEIWDKSLADTFEGSRKSKALFQILTSFHYSTPISGRKSSPFCIKDGIILIKTGFKHLKGNNNEWKHACKCWSLAESLVGILIERSSAQGPMSSNLGYVQYTWQDEKQ